MTKNDDGQKAIQDNQGGLADARHPPDNEYCAPPSPAAHTHASPVIPLNDSVRIPNPRYAEQVGLAGARNPDYPNPWAQPPAAVYLPHKRSDVMGNVDTHSRGPHDGFGQTVPGQVALYSVQAARAGAQAYNIYTAHSEQQGRPYDPLFNPSGIVQPPAINPTAIAPRFRQSTPLPHQQILIVSSQPEYDPNGLDASGNIHKPRSLKQVIRTADASLDACMICKIPFGQENPHPASFENIRQPDGKTVRVEINNVGAIETKVFLPCGHDIGSNCIVAHNFCPKCQASWQYPDCPHRIQMTTFKTDCKDAKNKCVECRVLDVEYEENLSGLLVRLQKLQEAYATLNKEMREEDLFDRTQLHLMITNTQRKVDAIKAQTNFIIQEADFQLSGYEE